MKMMMRLSLVVNVLVLTPVCWGLLLNAPWVSHGYGEFSAARGILLSIYAAIWLVSLGLLWRTSPTAVASLLMIQVMYKITTPLTVGTLDNPVVISNLVIAALHSVTLLLMLRDLRSRHPDPQPDSSV
jgi:hypothetical protein